MVVTTQRVEKVLITRVVDRMIESTDSSSPTVAINIVHCTTPHGPFADDIDEQTSVNAGITCQPMHQHMLTVRCR